MKKRLVSILLCAIMLIGTLPLFAIAKDDAMPFSDVKEGKWYYDYVKTAYENGWMSGVSQTLFNPNGELSRAMFVTILANFSGDDLSTYNEKPNFADVKADRWYTSAIAWAVDKQIASGYTNGNFGINDSITREQLCVMLYNYAFYKEYDVTQVLESAFNKFDDKDSAHSWSKDAVKWASTYSLISGMGTTETGEPILSPTSTATRAQATVILSAFVNTNFNQLTTPIAGLTLNGNPIENYKIVYGTTFTTNRDNYDGALAIANRLQTKLKTATGTELVVVKDTESEVGDYEILIGKTNREDAGVVTIDRSTFEDETVFVQMQGNYLVLASNELYKATYYAMELFLEDALGYYDMANGCEFITPSLNLNLEDGYTFIDAPFAESRVNIQRNGGYESTLSSDNVVHGFMNGVHSFAEFAQEDYVPTWDYHCQFYIDHDPCLSDSDNIDRIIRNVKTLIKAHPTGDRVWLTQTDTDYYCKCADCAKIYKAYGKCATYIQILQYVGEAIKDEYPNVKLVAIAYNFTHGLNLKVNLTDDEYATFLKTYTNERYVPSQTLVCPENIIMMYCTDNFCFSHALGDPNCTNAPKNAVKAEKEFRLWEELCQHIYVWDYPSGSSYKHQVFPIINWLYDNYHYYYEHGVEGFYILGDTDPYADFGEMKTYLLGKLSWNPGMSREEYDNYVNVFLKGYYGPGWSYIREFLDKTEELSTENEWNIWGKEQWNRIITREQYTENIDYLVSLFEKALALCDNEDQTLHVRQAYTQVKYIQTILAYKIYEDSQDEADLENFRAVNYAYHDWLLDVGYHVINNWTPDLNPELWNFWEYDIFA